MAKAVSNKKRLNLTKELAEISTTAFKSVFSSVLRFEPELKMMKKEEIRSEKVEISGIVGFFQNDIEGTLSFSCTLQTAYDLLGPFYGMKLDSVNNYVIGGMGEITNMTFGIIKEHFNSRGFDYEKCLPVVVVGNNHSVFSSCMGPRWVAKFTTPYGDLFLEINIHEKIATPKAG